MATGTRDVQAILGLSKPAIAIGFLRDEPAGMPMWSGGPVPAGCSFWRRAMDGESFYTAPSDHHNCAVGSYTHKIAVPEDRGSVLQDTLGFMVSNGYIQMAEVPAIPVLAETPRYIAYSPLERAAFAPDLVMVAARPYGAMLLYEAALRAGAGNALTNALGRPACAVLPLTMQTGSASLSFGCKGNRTFTGLPEDEMYLCVPGGKWQAVTEQLAAIEAANGAMEQYYRQHEAKFPVLP